MRGPITQSTPMLTVNSRPLPYLLVRVMPKVIDTPDVRCSCMSLQVACEDTSNRASQEAFTKSLPNLLAQPECRLCVRHSHC
jgi:hypothetical protein